MIVDEADVFFPAQKMQDLSRRAGPQFPKCVAMSATGLSRLQALECLGLPDGKPDVAITAGDLLEHKRIKQLKFVTIVTTVTPQDKPNITTFDAAPMSKKEKMRLVQCPDYLRFTLESALRTATNYLDTLDDVNAKIIVFGPSDAKGENIIMSALKDAVKSFNNLDYTYNGESTNDCDESESDDDGGEAQGKNKKKYQVVSSKQKLRRGYDDPSIAVVIFAVNVPCCASPRGGAGDPIR